MYMYDIGIKMFPLKAKKLKKIKKRELIYFCLYLAEEITTIKSKDKRNVVDNNAAVEIRKELAILEQKRKKRG